MSLKPDLSKQSLECLPRRTRTIKLVIKRFLRHTQYWTITGNSLVAKEYASRDEFMDAVIKPFNARLTKPLSPTIRSLYSEGDTVIVLFDGEATAIDGKPYRNTYAWFMEMRDGKIVKVIAFFDSITFDEFWRRVPPREQ